MDTPLQSSVCNKLLFNSLYKSAVRAVHPLV